MKNPKIIEGEIVERVEQLEQEQVIKLSAAALEAGMEPLRLLDLIAEGMDRVGKLYESQDYFIADLIMAGSIFKDVLKLERMADNFQRENSGRKIGSVVIGTAQGDIHDIGKDIFKGMMEVSGFLVIDLGVDIPKQIFVEKFHEYRPDIIGISGALTNTIETMKEIVDSFVESGNRNKVKIIVGGNHLTKDACRYIGADQFANDVTFGVHACKAWMSDISHKGVNKND
ncbi:methionine synthase [Peptococcaceae bacterium CEB3]|nr:methionine synthase [Peptococcaceae bacterium CEB3]